jgi:hypothetical protein
MILGSQDFGKLLVLIISHHEPALATANHYENHYENHHRMPISPLKNSRMAKLSIPWPDALDCVVTRRRQGNAVILYIDV